MGTAIVEALHGGHALTVIDTDPARLSALSYRYDVMTLEGDGASRRVLQEAGIETSDLVIACTSRDEVNIVAGILCERLSPSTRTIVRTQKVEYLEIWRERLLDVDFVVCSELETANAIARIIGLPAARQTDVFADGQVLMVEFDVPLDAADDETVGQTLREARIPADSKVASIIRGDRVIVPRGEEAIRPGDRVVVIGSPDAARAWGRIFGSRAQPRRGRGRVRRRGHRTRRRQGPGRGGGPRSDRRGRRRARAGRRRGAAARPRLQRRRHGRRSSSSASASGALRLPSSPWRATSKNLYAATLAKLHGVAFTVAVVTEPVSVGVLERAGVDVVVNPRVVTAEEIVRFAHDPRIHQLAMLEGDRFEILDIVVRGESALVGKAFRELPLTGSLIGAIVRDGAAIFPHGNDMLRAGDRAIVFTEASRVGDVERAL